MKIKFIFIFICLLSSVSFGQGWSVSNSDIRAKFNHDGVIGLPPPVGYTSGDFEDAKTTIGSAIAADSGATSYGTNSITYNYNATSISNNTYLGQKFDSFIELISSTHDCTYFIGVNPEYPEENSATHDISLTGTDPSKNYLVQFTLRIICRWDWAGDINHCKDPFFQSAVVNAQSNLVVEQDDEDYNKLEVFGSLNQGGSSYTVISDSHTINKNTTKVIDYPCQTVVSGNTIIPVILSGSGDNGYIFYTIPGNSSQDQKLNNIRRYIYIIVDDVIELD